MDSDSDDFFDSSFNMASTSKKRTKKGSLLKTPKRPRVSKPPIVTSSSSKTTKSPKQKSPPDSHPKAHVKIDNDCSLKNCVNCQMPFNLLLRWESPEVHTSTCLETDFSILPACPQGPSCDNTIRSHFAKFNHIELAIIRDNSFGDSLDLASVSQAQPSATGPKFKFKKVSAIITSSEDTSEDIKFLTKNTREDEKPSESSKTTDTYETANNDNVDNEKTDPKEIDFSDDDDDLFEELTNKALKIDAIKGKDGDIEIKVRVDPKVELETLVMKIPSQDSKIDVAGKIVAKKQGTLDAFFGLKPRAQPTPTPQVQPTYSSYGSGGRRRGGFHNQAKDDQNSEPKQRNCPFYKIMPDTTFTVDAFNYGTVPKITHYFLSHFHYDHYGGMTKSWRHPVVCSPITAKLVLLKIRIDQKYIKAMHLNQPEVIENVEVTLLDANHCPGSVMFLFKVIIDRIMSLN